MNALCICGAPLLRDEWGCTYCEDCADIGEPYAMYPITLTLPLPPSRNETQGVHHMVLHRMATAYKRDAWFMALTQHAPRFADDLPPSVDLHLTFVSNGKHDDDNVCDPKWAIDTLKIQRAKAWKQGVATEKGYIRDDSPAHMKLVGIQRVRSDNIKPCVIVKITPRAT